MQGTGPNMENPFQGIDLTEAITISGTPAAPESPPESAPSTESASQPASGTEGTSGTETTTPPASPGFDLGELGTFTAEELTGLLSELVDLRGQRQAYGDLDAKNQALSQRERENQEAIGALRLMKDPEIAQALEPILRKRAESQPRDPDNGRFVQRTDQKPEFRDGRVSDDFIQNAQRAIEYVAQQQEHARLSSIDQAWDAFKGKPELTGLIDDKFEKAVADEANKLTDRTGRLATGDDLVNIASKMLVQSGALVERGKRMLRDELKKQPVGTTVVTGQGGNDPPAPPPQDFDINKLGEALLAAGAIR